MKIIEVENVSKSFSDRKVLDSVSFTIEIFSPASALNNVDFPTFRLPTIATIGLLIIYISSLIFKGHYLF